MYQDFYENMQKYYIYWFLWSNYHIDRGVFQSKIYSIHPQTMNGSMYFFQYNAKHDTEYPILPYWDRFPLIFPFAPANGGFYGINLHYLPPNQRINLMTALIEAQGTIGGNLDDDYELQGLSYTIIKGFKPAQKCIKRYINTTAHRKSPFYGIGGADWAYAAGLPLQKFVGPQPW